MSRPKKLSANAFMTPFTLFTGFDFAGAAAFCDAVSPKLYTMHWSVMVEFWGRDLLAHNPGLDETLVVKALAHLFDLGDVITAERLSDYGYPKPHEPHPIPDDCQARKIAQVCAEARRAARWSRRLYTGTDRTMTFAGDFKWSPTARPTAYGSTAMAI